MTTTSTPSPSSAEGWKLVWDESEPDEMPVKKKIVLDVEPAIVSIKEPPKKVAKIEVVEEEPKLKPLPKQKFPDPPLQDTSKIFDNPVPSRSFTIIPVDVSNSSASTAQEYLDRKIVAKPATVKESAVIVCASCGKIVPSAVCPNCYPYGMCHTCHAPLAKEGHCAGCHPYGVCPVCQQPRQVEGICGNNYCRNQGPVIRCSLCKKALKLDGQCSNTLCIKSKVHSFDCNTASCKQYCKSPKVKGEDEETPESRDVRDIACKLWGVNRNTSLPKEAMDFYVAWGLQKLYDDEDAAKMLEKQVKRISKEFAAYFDLALGGELRHCMVYNGAYKAKIPKWLQSEYPCRQSRPCAWLRWKDVRDEYGLDALRSAVICFKLPGWPGSYGGNNWATIAFTLLEYLEGRHSAIAFLDSAFSLEHNCGCAFNKVYNTSALHEVLNVCFESPDVMDIVKSGYKHFIDPKLIEIAEKHGKA